MADMENDKDREDQNMDERQKQWVKCFTTYIVVKNVNNSIFMAFASFTVKIMTAKPVHDTHS